MSNFITDTVQAESSSQVANIEVALRMANVAYVKTNPGPGEFSSIVSALASITTNAVSSPWALYVAPGVYTENAITMKPYVYVIGSGDEDTRLIAASTTGVFITASDNSSISRCLITGATGSGGIGIQYSSTTGSDATPFSVVSCRLGAHETIAKVSASTVPNQLTFFDCRIGGPYSFTNGFFATTSGAGTAKIQLMGCTTNGTTAPQPAYIGYVSGVGCEIIVNGCQFRASSLTSGAGFRCDTGGGLRMSSLNIRNFATGIDVPNTGAAPEIHCNSILIQNCTTDVNIAHTGCTGSFNGVAKQNQVINASPTTTQISFQDPSYGYVVNNVMDINGLRTQKTSAATANSTTSLLASSAFCQEFTGTVAGQIVKLPNATTIQTGHRFEFWNNSTALITIQDNSSAVLLALASQQQASFVCDTNGSAAGTWLFTFTDYTPSLNIANSTNAFDDFLAGTATGVSTLGTLRWNIFVTGTGGLVTQPSANTDNAHVGVGNLACAAVSSIASLAIADIEIGGGQYITEYLVRVGALGSGTQNYVLQCGFGVNEQTTSDPTDGVYFEYSQAGSTQWRCRTTRASTSTTTASGVTVAANTWYKLKIIINPAATSVQFYVSAAGGGATSLVATTTTNIPLTTTGIRPIFKIRKTVGTGTVSFDVDYFQMQVNLTNVR